MFTSSPAAFGLLIFVLSLFICRAQPYGEPDHSHPGDAMIQEYLRRETEKIETNFLAEAKTAEEWNRLSKKYREDYLHMLGLWPMPERTPLRATITGTLERDDYVVELLHFQSRPGLYVTANLYRPARARADEKLPAVLYVCGHSGRGRNGNKTAFQSHGIWFARHGYVCLMLDTLQLGEIAGIHHGTYRENRWWWISRGYTSAGVECWNGLRGIDYLVSRPDVDPGRIAVTGISGGGAATFWIAAADERAKGAVPVSGMADLLSYIPNRVINGHCDCMFLYNTYQWPWTRIASLVAPRPLLFVNSDKDPIFPMDANDRVINRLERVYSLFGASHLVDSVVSIGGHDYRKDIRQAVYGFINTHLKNDPSPVSDSEVDLVTGPRESIHPIEPEKLRAFSSDSDIPADAINNKIDQEFVPMAKVEVPGKGEFSNWQTELLRPLRDVTFHHFPERIPAAQGPETISKEPVSIATEPGITIRMSKVKNSDKPKRAVLFITAIGLDQPLPGWLNEDSDAIYVCEPRGVGSSRWTHKNPPNYVERSHYLLGRTVDSGRVWDIAAAARYVRSLHKDVPVELAGETNAAVLAIYAALLEPDVASVRLHKPDATHMNPDAPTLLNVLRVCDIPEAIGMLAPRQVSISGLRGNEFQKSRRIYAAAGAEGKLAFRH